MRGSRFNETQVIGILKEHQAGLRVAEPCPANRTTHRPAFALGGVTHLVSKLTFSRVIETHSKSGGRSVVSPCSLDLESQIP